MRGRKRGFTLIELMIVVAIIGVLAALAIYGVRRYLSNAKGAEARLSIGGISRAAQAAYAREGTVSQVLQPGSPSAGVTRQLCNGAQPVPASPASIAGVKYQPTDQYGKDYNTGDGSSGWICLHFQIPTAQYYQYNYTGGATAGSSIADESNGAAPPVMQGSATQFSAEAVGDLNGDNVRSFFAMGGVITNGQLVIATTVYEHMPDE